MPTPAECILVASADMNDNAQEVYNNESLLPYFNMALQELVERMEEASIPVTDKVSSDAILVPAGTTEIGYSTTPALPADLIEIEQLWESNDSGLNWTPLTRRDFIDPNIASNEPTSYFGQYSWNEMHITLPEASADINLKIHYTRRLATDVTEDDLDTDIPITNSKLFLGHRTAALAAILVNQDEQRATVLNQLAEQSIERSMNIPTKAQQSVFTRRRPFRSAYKQFGRSY